MSEAPQREWRFYLGDMVLFCERVLEYTRGLDRPAFAADRLNYDATLRNLELVGKAATHIPKLSGLRSRTFPGARLSPRETGSSTPIWELMMTSSGAS